MHDVRLGARKEACNCSTPNAPGNRAWRERRLVSACSLSGIADVAVIASDISTLDPLLLPERIAFCLLDENLYQPMKIGLEEIYPRFSPAGIIVVDDCWSQSPHLFVKGVAEAYNGSMRAYREFMSTKGLAEDLVRLNSV